MSTNLHVVPTLQSSLHFAADNRAGAEPWAVGQYKTAWARESFHRHLPGNTHAVKDYLQRVEVEDLLTVQFHANTSSPFRLLFYTAEGRYLRPIPTSTVYTIPGNLRINNAGASEQLYTHHMTFSFAQLRSFIPNLDKGGFFRVAAEFRWAANGGTLPTEQRRQLVSEIVFVRKKWSGTVLIEARHRRNKDGFIWEQTNAITAIRLPATLTPGGSEAGAEIMEDGAERPLLLSANPYESFLLKGSQVPEFLAQKLNWIFVCGDVAVDGKRVVRMTSFALGEPAGRSRSVEATLRLQRPELAGGVSFASASPYGVAYSPSTDHIFTLPAGYPYTITSLTYGPHGGGQTSILGGATPNITSAAARADFIALINAERPFVGLYGRFVLQGLDLVFVWSELCLKQSLTGTLVDFSGGSGNSPGGGEAGG